MNTSSFVNVVLVGRSGRMGREIEAVAKECGVAIVGGADKKISISQCLSAQSDVQAVIDFSLPEATEEVLKACMDKHLPVVIGVTGMGETQKKLMKKASEKIPVLYSANMSLGVQILAKAIESLKGVEGFDLSIEEFHHRHKRDRPSGTALLLDDELQKRIGRRAHEIVSLRGGGIVGDHRIYAMSDSEVVTFSHQALNRSVFARGACRAARWIVGRPASLYSLADLLEKA